jgi:hypothetical protein
VRAARLRLYESPLHLEGGAFHADGEGTVLTTESCVLNPNRNPGLTKREAERELCHALGASKVIWLPGAPVEGDLTDGHVDGLACFARPGLVLLETLTGADDATRALLRENRRALEGASDAKGRPLEVVEMEEAWEAEPGSATWCRSYINFYVANGGVVMPAYGVPGDARSARGGRAHLDARGQRTPTARHLLGSFARGEDRLRGGAAAGLDSEPGNRMRHWIPFADQLAGPRGALAALLLVGTVLAAAGCASPAQPSAMVPEDVPVLAREPRTVNLRVFGGEPTLPLGRSKISNEAFVEALASGLARAGLLLAVVDEPGDYRLDVAIEEIAQPYIAFPMTVRIVTRWELARRGEREPFWTDTIHSAHTVPFVAEFFGIRRLRLANEGAARAAILEGIRRLASHLT